jgi:hypothetical protein
MFWHSGGGKPGHRARSRYGPPTIPGENPPSSTMPWSARLSRLDLCGAFEADIRFKANYVCLLRLYVSLRSD